jgi:glycosyltransferase involved in cell wall biosynthesis
MPEDLDVLIAATTLGPGGTEVYVEDLAIGLAKRGLRVAVSVDSEPLDRSTTIAAAEVKVIPLMISSECTRDQYSARWNQLLTVYRPALIHANLWLREDLLRQIAAAHDIPFVVTGHHTVPAIRLRDRLGLNSIPFAMYRRRRLLSKGNGGMICISEMSLRNYRHRYGSRARAVRVYLGRPAESSVSADPMGGGMSPSILWAGSLISRKRPFLAINAVASVFNDFPGSTLVMAGGGELESEVRAAAEKFGGRIVLTGHVFSVTHLLASADLLLHTACNEGTPLAILEAMAAGLPVIATDAGATRELVAHQQTGLLVPIDDARGLADALRTLVSNPQLRAEYGNAAKAHCATRFGFNRMLDETLIAYRVLVGIDFTPAVSGEPLGASQYVGAKPGLC